MFWHGRRVLVTGGCGFIGSHLVEALLQRGAQVSVLGKYNSRSDPGFLRGVDHPDLTVRLGDVADPWFVQSMAREVDTIFHLAALIGIPYSYAAPSQYVETNIKGTLAVLEAARRESVRRVVHTSTSETYGTAQYTPIDESPSGRPVSLLRHEDRRGQARRELSPFVRPAGGHPAPLQHVRPPPVPAGRHSHLDGPGPLRRRDHRRRARSRARHELRRRYRGGLPGRRGRGGCGGQRLQRRLGPGAHDRRDPGAGPEGRGSGQAGPPAGGEGAPREERGRPAHLRLLESRGGLPVRPVDPAGPGARAGPRLPSVEPPEHDPNLYRV